MYIIIIIIIICRCRRRNAERKLDQWRFVINNLQESSANEENMKRATQEGLGINVIGSSPYNMRKPGKRGGKKSKKVNNREDEWQGRNLLSSPTYDEEEMLDIIPTDPRQMETFMKYPPPVLEDALCRQQQ